MIRQIYIILLSLLSFAMLVENKEQVKMVPWMPLREPASTRFQQRTHVATDKPVYKPGDVVFIEVFAFDALTKAPLTEVVVERKLWSGDKAGWAWQKEHHPANASVTVFDSAQNQVFKSESVQGQNGTFAFTWKLAADQAGGDYYVQALKANSLPGCFDQDFSSWRKFRVESYS